MSKFEQEHPDKWEGPWSESEDKIPRSIAQERARYVFLYTHYDPMQPALYGARVDLPQLPLAESMPPFLAFLFGVEDTPLPRTPC